MVKNEKNILEDILKKNGFADAAETLIQDLSNVVQAATFGNKVATALKQRKQGHFDKAMLNISEVNRDQVLSIREIQTIIDGIKGVPKKEIIFEKFRQFYPFQIGLTNGEDVLELLSLIKYECDFTLEESIADLHKNEEMIDSMIEKLNFYETRMKGQIPEDEINELKTNVGRIQKRILEIKTCLIDCICGVIREIYSQISIVDKIALVKNNYLILSSSIQTLNAKIVEVEQIT